MRKWLVGIILLAVVVGLGIWGYTVLFPSPQKVIRKRLLEVAKTASFAPNEAPLAKLANAQHLTTFCTSDLEIAVDVPGAHRTFQGRDELLQGAMGVRSYLSALNVEFLDINVNLAPNQQSAVANLTVKGKVPGERDIIVQELKFDLKKIGGEWLIRKIETVKTLSDRRALLSSPRV